MSSCVGFGSVLSLSSSVSLSLVVFVPPSGPPPLRGGGLFMQSTDRESERRKIIYSTVTT